MITKIFKNLEEFQKHLKNNPNDNCNGCTQEFLDKHNITLEEYEKMNQDHCNSRCFNCWNCYNCVESINCNDCYWCENCKNCNNCVGINNSNETENKENNNKEILLSDSIKYCFRFTHIESCKFLNNLITISKAGRKGDWVECLKKVLQELKKIDIDIIKQACKDDTADPFLLTEIGKENSIKAINYYDQYIEPLDDNVYLRTAATNTDKKMRDLRGLFDKYEIKYPEINRESLSFNLLLNNVKKWNNKKNEITELDSDEEEETKNDEQNVIETKLFEDLEEFQKYLKNNPNEKCNGCSQEFLNENNITLEEYSIMNESNTRCWNALDCENCVGMSSKEDNVFAKKTLKAFTFGGNMPITVTNNGRDQGWADMLRKVVNELYKDQKYKDIIKSECKDKPNSTSLLLTKNGRDIKISQDEERYKSQIEEIDKDVFLYKNTNNNVKVKQLITLLEKCKINPDSLYFTLCNKGEDEAGEETEGENVVGNLELAEDLYVKYGFPRNRIVFGAPGTGKSYRLEQNRKEHFNDSKCYERVTFHPNYSYSNFVGTYKPVSEGNEIKYKYVPGPFLRVIVKALANPDKNYLLLIEEINRANVAAVFGDVFQILDRDNDNKSEYPIDLSEDIKRYLKKIIEDDESEEEVKKLAKEAINLLDTVDKGKLYIPSNMYIWATMNSADQGVFPMDTAFKRRWDFEYIGIDEEEIAVINEETKTKLKDLKIPIPVIVDEKTSEKSQGVEVSNKGNDDKNKKYKFVKWNELRQRINDHLINSKINEDKLLGPFFLSKSVLESADKLANEVDLANRDENKVKEEINRFVKLFESKVIMYLFEDVMKIHRDKIFNKCDKMIFSEICKNFEKDGIKVFKFSDTKEENEKIIKKLLGIMQGQDNTPPQNNPE